MKKHAAPRYVSNADELQNRTKAFGREQVERRARRRAAGCDDDDAANSSDEGLASATSKMALSSDEDDGPVSLLPALFSLFLTGTVIANFI